MARGPSSLFDAFSSKGAPAPGERGYVEPGSISPRAIKAQEAARAVFEALLELADSPDAPFVNAASDCWATGDDDACDAIEDDVDEWVALAGDLSPFADLGDEDELFFTLWEVAGQIQSGQMARSVAEAILADAVAPPHERMRLVNVTKDEAADFIARHHSHLPKLNPKGLMYAVGALAGGKLVAVATAGTPTGRWSGADRTPPCGPHGILELTRIASDGSTKNAASMLAARLIDAHTRSGRQDASGCMFVTYSLTGEQAAVYKALRDKGLRPVARLKGKDKTGGVRKGGSALADKHKIRWEAGASALPADWSLIDMAKTKTDKTGDKSPDLWTKGERTKANLAAMTILARGGVATKAERDALALYSGWGGLSIKDVADKFPAGLPAPDKAGLINEYYTPTLVAREVAKATSRLVKPLARVVGGPLKALEPSAGIGRFIEAFERESAGVDIKWEAVELSEVSARLLKARWPSLSVEHMPFERWAAGHADEARGNLHLVVANPPYGPRGLTKAEDPDGEYRGGLMKKAAYPYFLRRGLDLLAPGGIGVYLIPAGFLSSKQEAYLDLRSATLERHHVLAAFRLPSKVFPGADLVTDLIFFQSRGGVSPRALEGDDRTIAIGDYFEHHPEHILGTEVNKPVPGEAQDRFERYKIEGKFKGLPGFEPRPMSSAPVVPIAIKKVKAIRGVARSEDSAALDIGLDEGEREAAVLGRRVARYFGSLATEDPDEGRQRFAIWRELRFALSSWKEAHGFPRTAKMGALSAAHPSIGRFLSAWDAAGSLIDAISEAPQDWEPALKGEPSPIAALDFVWRKTDRPVSLAAWIEAYGRWARVDATEARSHCIKAIPRLVEVWPIDVDGGDLVLQPSESYFSGHLWPKLDRAKAELSSGRNFGVVSHGGLAAIWSSQAQRLEIAIDPVIAEQIDLSPTQAWVPLEVLERWCSKRYGVDVELERSGGMLTLKGLPYAEIVENIGKLRAKGADKTEFKRFLGWVNGDGGLFSFRSDVVNGVVVESADDKKTDWIEKAEKSFREAIDADDESKDAIEVSYNRAIRGWVAPDYSGAPLSIGRFVSEIVPHDYQNRAARRVLSNNGGVIALDVGLGKTLTGMMVLGRLMQEGRARRPVIVVPKPIMLKWERDLLGVYPDLRVGLIGVKKVLKTSGKNKGKVISETDSAAERGAKWSAFAAGHLDVMLVSYPALPRTQFKVESLARFFENQSAIMRDISAQRRKDAKKKNKDGKKGGRGFSERDEAVKEQSVAGWMVDQLAIPSNWSWDSGPTWDELGVDFLMIDEAQNFKNLYFPQEGIEFMGTGEASKRSWQLALRCRDVQSRKGAVVCLSATPAKNSPLEFYSIMDLAAPQAFADVGIPHSEAFIHRFIRVETVSVPKPTGAVVSQRAAVGFKNLDELRYVMGRYAEFRTAEEVGLKLPEVEVSVVDARPTMEQSRLFAQFAREYEDAAKAAARGEGSTNALLGVLMRMSLTAIHPDLGRRQEDEGFRWDWDNANDNPDFASPKFLALAANVLRRPDCGHIVFLESVAGQWWVSRTLIEAGVPEDRITFLNAQAAKEVSERQERADDFNGDPESDLPPRYDVIICNSIAYEGIDLQTRTCAIHHLDIPWEPATLQQRNGRGVRQGNKLTDVGIYYYVVPNSVEGVKLAKIQGKRAWLIDLVKGQDRATNSPFAQGAEDALDDALINLLFPDPAAAKLALSRNKAMVDIGKSNKAAQRAGAQFMAARAMIRKGLRVRGDSPQVAAALDKKAEVILGDLAALPADIWPWSQVQGAIWRDPEHCLVPETQLQLGAPTWRAQNNERGEAGDELVNITPSNFARAIFLPGLQLTVGDITVRLGREYLVYRAFSPSTVEIGWTELASLSKLKSFERRPPQSALVDPVAWRAWQIEAGADLARSTTHKAVDPILGMDLSGKQAWEVSADRLKWRLADEQWIAEVWRRHGPAIKALGTKSTLDSSARGIPALRAGKVIRLSGYNERLLPDDELFEPSLTGYRQFLDLLPHAGIGDTDARAMQEASKAWFARTPNLSSFKPPKVEAPVAPVAPAAPPSEASFAGRIKAKLEAARVRRSLVSIKTRAVSEGVSASLLTMIERLEAVLKSKEMELAA